MSVEAFTAALLSAGPHPDLPAEHRIFAPFIGDWDLLVTWYARGEPVRRERGEWSFSWVLEGRAVQDVWIVPPRGAPAADLYEYGTSLRFYDPEIEAWRSLWIGPVRRAVERFVARKVGEEVVLETRRDDGERMRWVFCDVTQDAFRWRNEVEGPDGWVLTQDFAATRRTRLPDR